MSGARKVFIKSFGCQMNVYDSHRMADTLAPEGYVETDRAENADLVVLNTCHIREKAVDKVYSELGRLRDMKDEAALAGRRVAIAVAGCVAQAEGKEIFRRERAVDLVVGPQSYHRLPDLLRKAEREGRALDTEFPAEDKFDFLKPASREATHKRGVVAFVTIQEGCDKFCTFCVVPYTRGAEVSRPVAKIIADVERLADSGVREVTLLGQNVNAYHGNGPDGKAWTLGQLLWRLADIPGIARLRYTTSHPRDVDESLIAAHRDLPALMPQLHLPVQSGSDRILAAMNRQHTARDYLALIERLRAAQPTLCFTSDFIVGFPGESDEDFRATLRLIEDADITTAFSFKYSPRPGTPAAEMVDQIDEDVKADRLGQLQTLVNRQHERFQQSCIGRTFDVLFDKLGKFAGQITGRSPYLQPVQVTGSQSLIGTIAPVTITGTRTDAKSLFGVVAQPAGQLHKAAAVAEAGA